MYFGIGTTEPCERFHSTYNILHANKAITVAFFFTSVLTSQTMLTASTQIMKSVMTSVIPVKR